MNRTTPRLPVLLIAFAVVTAPLSAAPSSPVVEAPSLMESALAAAASGAWRAQNTSTITTGRIRDDDNKRSALAFAISGAAAFAGAFLWRWLPCRNAKEGNDIGGLRIAGYNKCYDSDGERKGLDTPTKLMLGAGVTLELVSLGYFIAHRMGRGEDQSE